MKNFFKQKTSWTNAEFIPLKLCIASAYIMIGAYFGDFIKQYKVVFIILFSVTVVWSVYLWITKMKKEDQV